MIEVHQHRGYFGPLCPYCKAAFESAERAVRCDRCSTLHHAICWLQNGNHCSIFRCTGTLPALPATRRAVLLRSILALYCLCNLTIHFFIHPVGRLIESVHAADALALLLMECGIAAGGLALLTKLFYKPHSETIGSLSILGSVLVGTNVVFLSFLLYILISKGMQSLYALVSF